MSAVLALTVSAACSDSTESNAIDLSVAPTTVTTTPGAPGVATITIARGGSFTGDVTLAAENLPAGVTASFAPPSLGSTTNSSSLTLTASTAAVAGTTPITVRASATGAKAKTATIQLTVNAASITLTAGAATVTTTQGATPTLGLTIARNGGFAGPVTLSAQGLPANVTANFTPSTLGAGVTTGTLALNVATNAPVGTTSFTIRAAGAGIAEQIIPVQLVINTGAQPDFTLSATPASVSVNPGAIATTTIGITRTAGFLDNVGFVTSQLPSGVVATFTPNPANANSAVLSLATTAQTTPGTYTVTVSGSGGNVGNRTATVMLTVNPPPGITLALNPVTTSVAAGGTVTNTLTVTRVGGFAGDITFSATNLANGLSVTFSPATLTGAATTTTATITAAANTVPNLYTMTLNAIGASTGASLTASVPLNITVTAPASIGLALGTNAVTVAPGGTGTINATISRGGGFAGAVNLAVSGLPSGVTATVTPASLTGATTAAAVSLVAGAQTAPGTYNGTLTASGTGVTSVAQNFTVTVSGGTGGGGNGNIRWQFCSTTGIPVFFAFKDGRNGAWTRVQPNASNLFSFDLTQPQGGVLVVKPNGGSFTTSMYLMTAAELDAAAANECVTTPTGFKSFTGSVVALSALETATISMGGGTGSASFGNLNYTLTNVLNGVQDLVATRSAINISTASIDLNKILIRRNLNLNSGAVIAPLDFTSGEAFDPISANVSLSNLGSDNATLTSFFNTQNGGSTLLGLPSSGTSATRTVFGVPAAALVGSDLHLLLASATSGDLSSVRSVFSYSNGLNGSGVTFGAVLDQPMVSSTTSTVSRPRASGGFQADYPTSIAATFTQGAKAITITGTSGYFGGAGYDLEYPDLTAIAQYDPSYGLSRSATTNYSITGTNATSGNIGSGTTFRTATRLGSFISSAIRR